MRRTSIGPAATFSLAEARDARHEARRLRDRGIDPLEARGDANYTNPFLSICRGYRKRCLSPAVARPLAKDHAAKPTCLYRHFASDDTLLYVGISLNHLHRLGQHKNNAHWYDRIVRVTIERFPTRKEAKAAEDTAIANENPECNIVRPARRPVRISQKARKSGRRYAATLDSRLAAP